MNTSRMIIMTLILGLLGQLYAYAGQPLKLEAKEGYYQFPFFDTQTPVWSYNDQIPGPLIRGKVGTTLVIDFFNGSKGTVEHPLAWLTYRKCHGRGSGCHPGSGRTGREFHISLETRRRGNFLVSSSFQLQRTVGKRPERGVHCRRG